MMKNFTVIPNEMLEQSQLSTQARYLFCILKKYCGQNEWCYPNQKTLGKNMGYSARYIRDLLKELESNGLIEKRRTGFNKPNNYRVTKEFTRTRNYNAGHLGSRMPLNGGMTLPDKSTYTKAKGKRNMEIVREKLTENGTIKPSQIVLKGILNDQPNVVLMSH